MAEFRDGEIVDVAIKGARVVNSYPTRRDHEDTGLVLVVQLTDDTGALADGRSVAVNLKSPGVSVTRVAPAEWPPQVGDLWRDRDGDLWFGCVYYDIHNDTHVTLSPARAKHTQAWGEGGAEAARQEYGPLTLVHREQQAGGEPE